MIFLRGKRDNTPEESRIYLNLDMNLGSQFVSKKHFSMCSFGIVSLEILSHDIVFK